METDPNVLVLLVAGGTEAIVSANPPACPVVCEACQASQSHHTLPVLVTSPVGRAETTLVTESTKQIIPNLVDNGNYRAFLDAIANISVSDDSGQAVAVALEMDVAKQVAVLTIAMNRGDASNLVAYLNGICRLLGIMSSRWETLRQGVEQTGIYSAPSPEDVEPWRTEFIKRIYRYCALSYLAHFERESSGLRFFVRRWRHSKEHILRLKFEDAVHSLHLTHGFLARIARGNKLTDEEWADLICLMDGTVHNIGELLDTCYCEEWAKASQLRNGQISLYPLRSTLETLIGQHRHICNLLCFAQSPGSRPALRSKMIICLMPRHPDIPIVLPTSQLFWQSLIESVCGENVIASYTWHEEQVTKLFSTYRDGQYSHTVHGPCALIAYLETARNTSEPPFSYIGVSSKTCSACHEWIQAFNAVGGYQYSTRGTSGHWRPLWGMPQLRSGWQNAQVKARTGRLVTATYVDFWTAKGKLYPAGKIPDTNGRSGDSAPALDPAKRSQALIEIESNRVTSWGW